MTIAVRPPSEKELALSAPVRHRAFHRNIEAKAAELKAAKLRAAAQKFALPSCGAEAIAPEAMPAEPDPPKEKHWFHVVGLVSGSLSIDTVKRAVCDEFGITHAELISPRRDHALVIPRQIAAWLCKELIPSRSLPEIGRRFGNRDHTTIIAACRRAPKRVAADAKLAARVEKIRAELAEAFT